MARDSPAKAGLILWTTANAGLRAWRSVGASRARQEANAPYITEVPAEGLSPRCCRLRRLLYAPPAPYTRGRFERTYQWMISYSDLVASGTIYESAVDNRAWE